MDAFVGIVGIVKNRLEGRKSLCIRGLRERPSLQSR